VDGVFGQGTKDAVVLFQKRNGITPDGIVGTDTANAIGITIGKGSYTPSGGSMSSGDVYLLARVVYGEARGEPYAGKVAVAAVVLNRVASAKFPNTIAGVVYQPGAFDCVSDGQINLAPDAEAIRAARDAMNGWDPSGGAIYYYNPNTATSSWIWSRPIIAVLGGHNFAA
jgi:N-acetylmuramoyl-L-alanine amidase